ncbi:MAG: hypothetical protein P8M53_11055 [Pirellulales bacterium]|nr:hypothetical protein [Pirellulales bacterium]
MENLSLTSPAGVLEMKEIQQNLASDPWTDVSGDMEAKTEIIGLIRERLRDSVYIAIRSVDAQYSEGKLYFRGIVPTFYTKQVLLSLVEDLAAKGVIKIVDETRVLKR